MTHATATMTSAHIIPLIRFLDFHNKHHPLLLPAPNWLQSASEVRPIAGATEFPAFNLRMEISKYHNLRAIILQVHTLTLSFIMVDHNTLKRAILQHISSD